MVVGRDGLHMAIPEDVCANHDDVVGQQELVARQATVEKSLVVGVGTTEQVGQTGVVGDDFAHHIAADDPVMVVFAGFEKFFIDGKELDIFLKKLDSK